MRRSVPGISRTSTLRLPPASPAVDKVAARFRLTLEVHWIICIAPAFPRRRGSGVRAWYQCGLQQLHLTTEKDASVVNKPSGRHPAFRVGNLEALRHRLEAAGVEIIAANRFPGQERFFVRDPWGNRLEFVERTGG